MGINFSKEEPSGEINAIVSDIVSRDQNFKDGELQDLYENVCTKYITAAAEDINKHFKKKDLYDVETALYVIPRSMNSRNKTQICDSIKNYYDRTLKLLISIRLILDTENNSQKSFAQIISKNLIVDQNVVRLTYCNVPQKDLKNTNNNFKLDFAIAPGLQFFTENVLSHEEYTSFLRNLQMILERKTTRIFCQASELKDMNITKSRQCVPAKDKKKEDFMMFVDQMNAVLAPKLCNSSPTLTVSYIGDVKKSIEEYQNNYQKKITAIKRNLNSLVKYDKKNEKYVLLHVPITKLIDVENSLKNNLKLMFLQTIKDFQKIITAVLKNHNE